MKKEEKLSDICRKEEKITTAKEWLFILFFAIGIISFIFAVMAIIKAFGVAAMPGDNLVKEQELLILIIVSLWVVIIDVLSGYFTIRCLSKKIDKLNREKIDLLK